MTYETSNKLYGPIWGDIPAVWVQEIARYIKQLGPKKLVLWMAYMVSTNHAFLFQRSKSSLLTYMH